MKAHKQITLEDFKCSQPEPKLYDQLLKNDTWVCSDCGATLKDRNDWCGPCGRAWSTSHLDWLKINNDEFDKWYAQHQHALSQHTIKGNGIHVSENGESTTPEILEGRKKYAKDLIQPFREGVMSKEFVEAYPEQAKKYPKDLVSKARNVWK